MMLAPAMANAATAHPAHMHTASNVSKASYSPGSFYSPRSSYAGQPSYQGAGGNFDLFNLLEEIL
jgi:hypothetical protein